MPNGYGRSNGNSNTIKVIVSAMALMATMFVTSISTAWWLSHERTTTFDTLKHHRLIIDSNAMRIKQLEKERERIIRIETDVQWIRSQIERSNGHVD